MWHAVCLSVLSFEVALVSCVLVLEEQHFGCGFSFFCAGGMGHCAWEHLHCICIHIPYIYIRVYIIINIDIYVYV
jgi:hypothetical protein